MWHPKQNSMIFPGQGIPPSLVSPKPCMEDAKLLPSSGVSDIDLLTGPSRKRKTVGMDLQGNNTSHGFSRLVLDYSFCGQPNQQHKVAASSGMNLPENAMGKFSNQISQTAEPIEEVLHFGHYQYHGSNNMPWSSQISERNSSKTTSDMSNSRSNAESHCLLPDLSLALINSPAGKIPALPDPQSLDYKMVSQIETHIFPSHPVPNNINMERVQSDHDLKALQLQHKASELFGSSNILTLKSRGSCHINLGGGKSIQEVHENISSSEVKQINGVLDIKKARDASSAKMNFSGTSESPAGMETVQSCQKSNDHLRSGTPENCVCAQMEDRGQTNAGQGIQNSEKTKEPNIKKMNNSLGEEISHKIADNPVQIVVEHMHGNDSQHASCDLDGKSKAWAGNIAPAIAEKLWDGSLQLNASVKVSASAFFKSGEKAPNIRWSHSIEVKGKVRLEAFEKFIQELPRSRSRGLMVTSLCWKVGSSEAGLAGIKEVAKGYKDGERVGFAQLSPGIDLYVCPRSDTIITILAKYGFFKGMAAIEDNQDSLIGCIVWRRHRSSLDSVSKKCERKSLPSSEQSRKQSRNSHSGNNRLNADASTQLAQEGNSFTPLGFEAGSMAPDNAKNKAFEGNNIQSNKAQIGVSSTAINTKLLPSVPDSPPGSSCGRQTDTHSYANLKGCMRLEVSAAHVDSSGKEKRPSSRELQRSLLPVRPQIAERQNKSVPDDDDLPEFDFSTACGVSNSPLGKSACLNNGHVSGTASLEMKPLANGAMNIGGPKPSMQNIVQRTTVAGHSKPESPSFPVLLDTSQGMPQQNKQLKVEYPRMVMPFSGAKPMSSHSELSSHPSICQPARNSLFRPSKNLWDDDDMPEWCPPDLEQQDQLPALSTLRPLIPIAPSQIPNSTSEKRPQAPPMPMPPPPTPPVSIHLPLQTGGLPHGHQHCPIVVTMKPAQSQINPAGGHLQFGPRSSTSLPPRPNIFNARLHMQAGWRSRGP